MGEIVDGLAMLEAARMLRDSLPILADDNPTGIGAHIHRLVLDVRMAPRPGQAVRQTQEGRLAQAPQKRLETYTQSVKSAGPITAPPKGYLRV